MADVYSLAPLAPVLLAVVVAVTLVGLVVSVIVGVGDD